MDAQEIISKLETGDYTIEYREECNCSGYWEIERGELQFQGESGEDWTGYVLSVGDELVAERIRFGENRIFIDDLTWDDIPDNVYEQMSSSSIVEQGETVNKAHAKRMREALIDFLLDGDYELDRDDERGFGNEYTMILRELPAGQKAEITQEQAEEWADDYLYNGDVVTEAFVGFRLV